MTTETIEFTQEPAEPSSDTRSLGERTRSSSSPPKRVLTKTRLVVLALIAILPQPLKRAAYRLIFGYRIGRRVRIGLSLLDAAECEIGDDTRIGHFNVFLRLGKLRIGDHCRIGILNTFRGGRELTIGRYVDILRLNVINSIPDNDCIGNPDARISIGDGSIITEGHRLDFTDSIRIGRRVIVGGRNSSLWTHNRRQTKPIRIEDRCYLGSEIRMAPGAEIATRCVVGLGSVVIGPIEGGSKLIAGNPARPIRDLGPAEFSYVDEKTRPDLPDDLDPS